MLHQTRQTSVVRHADYGLSRLLLARFTFPRVSFALAVQMSGSGRAVVMLDVVLDREDESFHITKDAASNALVDDIAEEALHHVQRGTAGRCLWNPRVAASQR